MTTMRQLLRISLNSERHSLFLHPEICKPYEPRFSEPKILSPPQKLLWEPSKNDSCLPSGKTSSAKEVPFRVGVVFGV